MNIGLIVDENPISRSYINVLKEANVSFKYLIILNPKSIFPNFISLRLNFNKNNYWPLKFLKQKDYLYLCHQVEDFFMKLEKSKLKIHSIVNATGSNIRMKWINELTYEEWDNVMRSDADGFFNLIKNSLPLMRKFGGSYTTLSSIGLSRWPSKDVLSVAPKAAIDALITGIAREEGKNNIRSNSIQLGIIEAGIFLRLKGKDYDDRYIEAAKNNTALKRLGTAQDVADAVIFLSSNRARYITGQTLYLDGGYRI